MKKLLLIAALGLFVVGQAQATVSASYSYLKDRGARVYVDTMRWSNKHGIGTGGLIDTMVLSAEVDTTTELDIANLEAMSAMFRIGGVQTTAGGTGTTQCSLDVSLDGTNWITNAGIPLFSTTATAGSKTTLSTAMRTYFAVDVDSVVTATDVPSVRGKAVMQGARLARFRCVRTSFATNGSTPVLTDSAFLRLIVLRSHKPYNP